MSVSKAFRGRLLSKSRASLHSDNHEMLVLGHHYLLLGLQASRARIDAEFVQVDRQIVLEDEFEERMRGVIAEPH